MYGKRKYFRAKPSLHGKISPKTNLYYLDKTATEVTIPVYYPHAL